MHEIFHYNEDYEENIVYNRITYLPNPFVSKKLDNTSHVG